MVAADTDYRFMAMNDLINELQVNTLRLDLQSEKRVGDNLFFSHSF